MKKVLSLLLAGIMVISLASCNLKEKSAELLVEAYIELTLSTDSWKEVEKSCEDSGMEVSLEARGTTLVYKYNFTVELEEGAAELLEQSLKDSEENLKASAKTIKEEQPAIEKVVWEYYDIEGNFLASAEQ